MAIIRDAALDWPISGFCDHHSVEATVTNFVEEARHYCDLIERSQTANTWRFANECLQSVLRLYSAGLALPEGEAGDQDANSRIGYAEWQRTRRIAAEKLSRDYYWKIFEPWERQPPEPIAGSISDDLADIWREIRNGLQIFGTDVNAAVWHWRFSMETHWAHHAVGAAGALTALCFGPEADGTRP